MITKKHKQLMADYFMKRAEFTATDLEEYDCDEDDCYLTYNALELFNGIVIQEEYDDTCDRSTEYFYMDLKTNKIRECTEMEDNFMRGGDLNENGFREYDPDYIVSKTVGNKVNIFKGGKL